MLSSDPHHEHVNIVRTLIYGYPANGAMSSVRFTARFDNLSQKGNQRMDRIILFCLFREQQVLAMQRW